MLVGVASMDCAGVNSMMKSAKIHPFTTVLSLYLMSNSLSSIAHFISLPEVSGLCNICFIGYSIGTSTDKLGSKVGVFWIQLPMPGSAFPSLGTSPPLPSELGYNSRLVVVPYIVLLPGRH